MKYTSKSESSGDYLFELFLALQCNTMLSIFHFIFDFFHQNYKGNFSAKVIRRCLHCLKNCFHHCTSCIYLSFSPKFFFFLLLWFLAILQDHFGILDDTVFLGCFCFHTWQLIYPVYLLQIPQAAKNWFTSMLTVQGIESLLEKKLEQTHLITFIKDTCLPWFVVLQHTTGTPVSYPWIMRILITRGNKK